MFMVGLNSREGRRSAIYLLFLVSALTLYQKSLADHTVRQVLVLSSYHHQLPWTREFIKGIHLAANEEGMAWQFYFENMDATRTDPLDDSIYLNYLAAKYGDMRFDGVIADSEPATEFIKRSRDKLNIPAHVYYSDSNDADANTLVIGASSIPYAEKTVDLALKQNPARKHIVLIESGAPQSENKASRIRAHLSDRPQVRLSVKSEFLLAELLDEIAAYSDDTLIIYNLVFSDRAGEQYSPRQIVEMITKISPVPVYGFYSTFLGTGIVGGCLNDAETVGRSALIALKDFYHQGKYADDYPVVKSVVDASVLAKFGIDPSFTEFDVHVVNSPVNWFARNYVYLIWGFVFSALLTLAGLIWAAKLRAVNSRLLEFNDQLVEAQNQLEITNINLKTQSMIDPLTGLLNRRAMLPILKEAIYESRRYQTASSIMLLDLDDFKSINDQYGHNCGDQVLMAVSASLGKATRISDSLARWGGEEFLVLAKATSIREAAVFAEHVRENISDLIFDDGVKITTSIGVSCIRADDSVVSLLERADKAMYQAKSQGKNCVVVTQEN